MIPIQQISRIFIINLWFIFKEKSPSMDELFTEEDNSASASKR